MLMGRQAHHALAYASSRFLPLLQHAPSGDAGLLAAKNANQRILCLKYLGRRRWRSVTSRCLNCQPEHEIHYATKLICPGCLNELVRKKDEKAQAE